MASTAEALRDRLEMESPFGESDEVEETEVEETSEDETTDEDATEVDETEETDEEPEDEEKLSHINDNLNIALKEERGLRQDAQSKIDELTKNSGLSQSALDDAEATIKDIKEQLKELDMEDLITIKGKVDPEVRNLLAEKQAAEKNKVDAENLAKFNSDMISEVNKSVADFNNIDLDNEDQGVLLQSMIYMASISGMEIEDAVKESMSRVDRMLKNTLKKRTPAVKPKRKLKSVSKTTQSTKTLTPLERIRLAREGQEK